MAQNNLKVIPLGGAEEIGKNITVIEYENDILVIDCGMAFPEVEMLGIDLVIPDITYLIENKDRIRGIVLTHGHEDHIGALPFVLREIDVPLYGSQLTIGLVKTKLKEFGLNQVSLTTVNPRDTIKLGCFKVEFIKTSHSILGAFGLCITTPIGKIVHTGDFKIDFTPVDGEVIDLGRYAAIGEEGVLLLMADSTNVERAGYTMSESKIGISLDHMFGDAKGRIIISTFSSNIHRIQQIINSASKYNRKICFAGRSMIRTSTVARELGALNVRDNLLVELNDIKNLPDNKVTVITTGSQGEPMSGLVRMANREHRQIEIKKGDTVILSASPIPGNEKFVGRIINQLFKRGAKVIHDSTDDVHVSGHACQEELKLIHRLISPKFFIPVHGEYRHLYLHSELAKELGMNEKNIVIPENGSVIEIPANTNKIVNTKKVQAGAIFVDGLGIGDVGSVVLRDRHHLAQDGLVVVVITISAQDGSVISGPDVISRGFIFVRDSAKLIKSSQEVVSQVIANRTSHKPLEWNALKTQIRNRLRRHLYTETKRNPMILPIIIEI